MGNSKAWKDKVGDGAFSPHFHAASELIGKRWTGAIVRALFHGRTRFREIADTIPGISDRLLAERLHELVEHGVIARAGPRGGYVLTEKGHDLRHIVIEIAKWAHRWRDEAAGAEPTKKPDATSAPTDEP